jgi:hypothetical protein
VLLADWTSIQFDVVATDRGLKRLAGSVLKSRLPTLDDVSGLSGLSV